MANATRPFSPTHFPQETHRIFQTKVYTSTPVNLCTHQHTQTHSHVHTFSPTKFAISFTALWRQNFVVLLQQRFPNRIIFLQSGPIFQEAPPTKLTPLAKNPRFAACFALFSCNSSRPPVIYAQRENSIFIVCASIPGLVDPPTPLRHDGRSVKT